MDRRIRIGEKVENRVGEKERKRDRRKGIIIIGEKDVKQMGK